MASAGASLAAGSILATQIRIGSTAVTCFVELFLPRQLSRAGWLRRVSQNASELTGPPLYFTACELGVRVDVQSLDVISRSPLLFRVCERVSSILAGTRSRYLPVPIDLGSLECPDCGDRITNHEGHADDLVCPEMHDTTCRGDERRACRSRSGGLHSTHRGGRAPDDPAPRTTGRAAEGKLLQEFAGRGGATSYRAAVGQAVGWLTGHRDRRWRHDHVFHEPRNS